jgi:hypothetical protein
MAATLVLPTQQLRFDQPVEGKPQETPQYHCLMSTYVTLQALNIVGQGNVMVSSDELILVLEANLQLSTLACDIEEPDFDALVFYMSSNNRMRGQAGRSTCLTLHLPYEKYEKIKEKYGSTLLNSGLLPWNVEVLLGMRRCINSSMARWRACRELTL